MIKRICFSLIFVCCLVAIPLALLGIKHVNIGGPFLAFLHNCNNELNDFKIAIPNIPEIPKPGATGGWWDVLQVLVTIGNVFISICNYAINFMNAIVSVLQFIFIVLKNLLTLKDTLGSTADSSYVPPVV